MAPQTCLPALSKPRSQLVISLSVTVTSLVAYAAPRNELAHMSPLVEPLHCVADVAFNFTPQPDRGVN